MTGGSDRRGDLWIDGPALESQQDADQEPDI
jgi:hypothetical protein